MMMKKILTLTFVMVFNLAAFQSHASQLSVGLDWDKGIFAQELWQDSRRIYLIENKTQTAVKLNVRLVKYDDHKLEPVDDNVVAWTVPASQVQSFDASVFQKKEGCESQCLLKFEIENGERLGVMAFLPAPKQAMGISVWNGMNGSGGQDGSDWVVQDQINYKSGAVFNLKVRLNEKSGTYEFPVADEKTAGVSSFKIISVKSKSLKIKKQDAKFTIDTVNPLSSHKIHEITLQLQAPVVKAPELVTVTGWHCERYTGTECVAGHQLARGVLISAE